jgi:hypothetical protein
MEIKGLDPKYQKVLEDLERLVADGISIANSPSLGVLAKLPGLMEHLRALVADLREALA